MAEEVVEVDPNSELIQTPRVKQLVKYFSKEGEFVDSVQDRDSSWAFFLQRENFQIKLTVTLPDGNEIVTVQAPSHWTVDQVKSHIFSSVISLRSLSSVDYVLGLTANQLFTIEFKRFKEAHRKLREATMTENVKEGIHVSLFSRSQRPYLARRHSLNLVRKDPPESPKTNSKARTKRSASKRKRKKTRTRGGKPTSINVYSSNSSNKSNESDSSLSPKSKVVTTARSLSPRKSKRSITVSSGDAVVTKLKRPRRVNSETRMRGSKPTTRRTRQSMKLSSPKKMRSPRDKKRHKRKTSDDYRRRRPSRRNRELENLPPLMPYKHVKIASKVKSNSAVDVPSKTARKSRKNRLTLAVQGESNGRTKTARSNSYSSLNPRGAVKPKKHRRRRSKGSKGVKKTPSTTTTVPKWWEEVPPTLHQPPPEPIFIEKMRGYPLHPPGNMSLEELRAYPLEVLNAENELPYYQTHFHGKEHTNYVGNDPGLNGPFAISTIKEHLSTGDKIIRVLLRTKMANTRFDVYTKPSKKKTVESLLKEVKPNLTLQNKIKQVKNKAISDDLLHFETRQLVSNYKVGVLYCKEGQVKEEDMFFNRHGSGLFTQFLNVIGEKVRMKGWDKYRAGLDVREDSTGQHSVFVSWQSYSIMYHVSTLLTFQPLQPQQVERKRHIGNDIVVIIFKEGHQDYKPDTVVSEYNHVMIVVTPHVKSPDDIEYWVNIVVKEGVPDFGPPLPNPPVFKSDQFFRDWLLCKCTLLFQVFK